MGFDLESAIKHLNAVSAMEEAFQGYKSSRLSGPQHGYAEDGQQLNVNKDQNPVVRKLVAGDHFKGLKVAV